MNLLNCEQCQAHLFDFHEGRLGTDLSEKVDEHIQDCDECAALLNDIWRMKLVTTRWQDEQAPVSTSRVQRAWAWPQMLATAASVLALVMVLTDTHLVTNDDGFTVRVGRSGYVSDTALTKFKQEQAGLIESQMQRLTAQQLASNQLLMQTLLDTSRSERRNDLQNLVAYWNTSQTQTFRQTQEDLRYLIMSQAEDDKDIKQLSDAFQTINMQRGNDL